MYEPYGEEKKGFSFREKLNQLKERIREKTKDINMENLKFDKITIVAIALVLLMGVTSITSYISVTGKFKNVQAENEILQGQNNALQSQLDDVSQQLSTCASDLEYSQADLEITQGQLTKMTLDYQTTTTDLETCNDEKLTLASDLNEVNEELDKKKEEYNTLKDKYNNLKNDLEDMECNYARDVCKNSKFPMNYYFIEDNEVFCCSEKEIDSCFGEEPENTDDIKEITC